MILERTSEPRGQSEHHCSLTICAILPQGPIGQEWRLGSSLRKATVTCSSSKGQTLKPGEA